MKLRNVTITNFRSFGPVAVRIDIDTGLTAYVGNNGSGKTAIFGALAKLFGVSNAQRTIQKSDFHIAPTEPELVSSTMIVIDCTFSFPELDQDGDDAAVPEVFSHMSTTGEDDPLEVRMRLQATWTDDLTPDGTVEQEVRWVTSGGDDFDWDQCRRVQAVERSYVQLIYVPATRNAYDQVTSLLKGRLWRAALWSETLQAAVTAGSELVQAQFDEEAPARFISERLDRRWRQVHQGDTDTTPQLRVAESQLGDLIRRAEFVLFPDEAQRARRLEDLSDGQRSLFHIALTAATLEIERDALALEQDDAPFDQERLQRTYLTLLAIEEPENSLSPFFLSRVMTQAREIAGLASAQVMVSSHSASILSRVEPEEVRYVRLDHPGRHSDVRSLTLPTADGDAGRYIRLAVRAYPELYFARFVILAEGESEAIVIPRIADAMGLPLDRSFVPIVPLGGRFVSHFWRLLNELGIDHATLLDLDAGRQHGGARAIRYAVQQLRRVGRDMIDNPFVIDGTIDLDQLGQIEDADLIEEDQQHDWLRALRVEGVFFSSPIDLDFSMLRLFAEEYQFPRRGGQGPRTDAASIAAKKIATLKTGGDTDVYDDGWNDTFIWYPYLFLGQSKPDIHMAALSRLTPDELAADAPFELQAIVQRVRERLEL